MRYVFGILLVLGGLVGAAFSVKSLLWQQRAMTQFVEVPMTVVQTNVRASRGRKSTTYYPEITYRYEYKGSPYQAHQVFAYEHGSSSRSWADSIIARYQPKPPFRPGMQIEAPGGKAYIDPENPQDAILIREYFFTPYALAMLSLSAVLCGVAAMFTGSFGSGRKTMEAIALDDSGAKLLLPTENLKDRLRNSLVWLIGVAAIAIPLAAHWMFAAGTFTVGFVIAMSLAAVALVIFLAAAVRRWNVSRHISDARVTVNPAPLSRGMPMRIDMEADAFSPLNVEAVLARVTCIEHYREKRGNKTQVGTRTHREEEVQLAGESAVPAGQVVTGSGHALIQPHEWPATSPVGAGYPRYSFELRVTIKLRGMVDYKGSFPLHVE